MRGFRTALGAATIAVLAAKGATAEPEARYSSALEGLRTVSLVVEGRVSDGCWPRPEETKALVADRLQGHGLAVDGAGDGRNALYLFVLGYAMEGGRTCVWFVDLTHVGWRGPYRLIRGDKAGAQRRLRDSLTKLADIFAADWALSNRGAAEE
ncbi:MAG: hypothetical protein QNJ06_06280 [Kiloniellales bacterium]|nr:hypothetical protein [Kiloniellales bacterium]MDJ0983001.1 hypothetical protein [Kiloniellales bacterium]